MRDQLHQIFSKLKSTLQCKSPSTSCILGTLNLINIGYIKYLFFAESSTGILRGSLTIGLYEGCIFILVHHIYKLQPTCGNYKYMDKNIVNEIFPALTSRVFVLNFLRGIETIEFSIIEEPKFHQTLNHVLEGFFRIVFYGNEFLSIHFLVNIVVTFVHFI